MGVGGFLIIFPKNFDFYKIDYLKIQEALTGEFYIILKLKITILPIFVLIECKTLYVTNTPKQIHLSPRYLKESFKII